ncbi:hypothetical protein J3E69DRAFT_360906 [Trichoderma sp. SZMC 28015]
MLVDIFNTGVKGVCVFLNYCNRFYKYVVRLDAVTGEDRWIYTSIKPQIINTADFPRLSFRMDLYLAGMACHGIVFCLEDNPYSNVVEISDLEVIREIAAENFTNWKRKLNTVDKDKFRVA